MSSYTVLARYYDRLMGDFDYDGYLTLLEGMVSGRGADLCCGSGKIAIGLAKCGCKMIGVDSSAQMLSQAASCARKSGADVLWIGQDAADFVPMHPLDFVTCVCDGFNYLSSDQLAGAIAKIGGYVKKGGKLIFDVSTEYKLAEVLGDNVFCEDYDDVTYIWSNRYDAQKKRIRMQVGFFEPQGDGTYRRTDEEHIQYAHCHCDLIKLLDSDWEIECRDGERYGELTEKSVRAIYICTRK